MSLGLISLIGTSWSLNGNCGAVVLFVTGGARLSGWSLFILLTAELIGGKTEYWLRELLLGRVDLAISFYIEKNRLVLFVNNIPQLTKKALYNIGLHSFKSKYLCFETL